VIAWHACWWRLLEELQERSDFSLHAASASSGHAHVMLCDQTVVLPCSLLLCPSLESCSEQSNCFLTKMTSKTSTDWRVPVPPR